MSCAGKKGRPVLLGDLLARMAKGGKDSIGKGGEKRGVSSAPGGKKSQDTITGASDVKQKKASYPKEKKIRVDGRTKKGSRVKIRGYGPRRKGLEASRPEEP